MIMTSRLKIYFLCNRFFASVLDDDKFRVIIVKSTVPPSTTSEKVIPYLKAKRFSEERLFRSK